MKLIEKIEKEFDKKSEKRCLDISLNGAELWCKEKTVKQFLRSAILRVAEEAGKKGRKNMFYEIMVLIENEKWHSSADEIQKMLREKFNN